MGNPVDPFLFRMINDETPEPLQIQQHLPDPPQIDRPEPIAPEPSVRTWDI